MLHNSLCESNSLIEKYKRRNRHLIVWKENFTHPIIIKRKMNLVLKNKNAYLMLTFLFIPHWKCWTHVCGILIVDAQGIWQVINPSSKVLKKRKMDMSHLEMVVILKFLEKEWLKFWGYHCWPMCCTSRDLKQTFWASLKFVMRTFLFNSQRKGVSSLVNMVFKCWRDLELPTIAMVWFPNRSRHMTCDKSLFKSLRKRKMDMSCLEMVVILKFLEKERLKFWG